MINSMTGFGRAARALSSRYFVAVTAKSVNHRFLEASVRLPEFFWDAEPMVRAIAAEIFARGKVDISIRVQRTSQPEYSVRINEQIANAVIPRLRSMAEEHDVGHSFTGGDLLRIPDLLQVDAIDVETTDEEREALGSLVREALAQMQAMRAREGESLLADITARVAAIRTLQEELAGHREEIRRELFAAFELRVKEIASAAGVDVDQQRIAQEVVLMVEKGDIAEELTRLTHHLDQMEKAINGREPAGKKLDFLSQEMLRENNTMGSKSRSARLRTLVVELKTEVERIREQVQNVE
ncbi:MAG TPA: YicC/YloC family endoribonuclease [Thermoanaerobaculia bacterium]|nr:YicC/YloC family endoribonuclease [Thermoanaerobaculia bacterium]